jgi:hypothetical protein
MLRAARYRCEPTITMVAQVPSCVLHVATHKGLTLACTIVLGAWINRCRCGPAADGQLLGCKHSDPCIATKFALPDRHRLVTWV